MFDFDHIEAWGPELRRELAAVIPGDVSQAIASGKPKLIEDARDILLSKVDQKVVLRSVVNWLKLRTIFAYHGSRLTVKEIVDKQFEVGRCACDGINIESELPQASRREVERGRLPPLHC